MNIEQQSLQTPAFRGLLGFCSNFSPYQPEEYHTVNGITYTSNEHFYQAMKFEDLNIRQQIANHPAKGLKAFVRRMSGQIRTDWDQIKLHVMEQGLKHKFSQPRFKALLLSTGTTELVERNTWNDKFWGVCNGQGLNNLGVLLMKIRRESV